MRSSPIDNRRGLFSIFYILTTLAVIPEMFPSTFQCFYFTLHFYIMLHLIVSISTSAVSAFLFFTLATLYVTLCTLLNNSILWSSRYDNGKLSEVENKREKEENFHFNSLLAMFFFVIPAVGCLNVT